MNRDIFLRTVCLVAVFQFFTAAGARQGDLILSVNTLLMTLFTLFSYFMDGFAFAGEALCGKLLGESRESAGTTSSESDSSPQLNALVRRLFRWGGRMVVLFTVVYVAGGRSFLLLLTSDRAVVDAAMAYLPWAWLIPVAGVAAFVYDGVFIGITATRGMLLTSVVATAVFFLLFFTLFPTLANHALWLALIVYLATRGIGQWLWMRRVGLQKQCSDSPK